ncbi:MAG: ABC transporter ATP-binding protein, partial [Pseudoclavibacter sp.]
MKEPVAITGLTKRFGDATALAGIDLEIEPGEFVALLGPSGCGKTTTLRCLAGLETPSEGTVRVGDKTFVDIETGEHLPTHQREIGMVFQSYALWPHRTVKSNVAYPLRLRGASRRESSDRAERMLESVGLSRFLKRYPHELSGGQQQRVALARGLVSATRLMLFDEPLSNLDASLRLAMRSEIRKLHDQFEHTSVYVTHDQSEALAMADRVVVMRGGLIEQHGTPKEVFEHPRTTFVAKFLGVENIFPRERFSVGGGPELDTGLRLTSAIDGARDGSAIGFRSADVALETHDRADPDGLRFRGTVTRAAYAGSTYSVTLTLEDGTDVEATVPSDGLNDQRACEVGTVHQALVPSHKL